MKGWFQRKGKQNKTIYEVTRELYVLFGEGIWTIWPLMHGNDEDEEEEMKEEKK
ncbi:hypothetical protein RND71_024400 [Anisodus tanguticus]|uniref:Uncharacterized protein n=1 Tax=Anisodus tanguticus TaxID=243964 RepID=A0AAE1RQK9_9SOLA|nr:hypothetical protein RND71_024400 [Anisodus tanguticus]